jgi:predicted nucleic acid-binding protein
VREGHPRYDACALASGTKLVVTGDKSLLKVSGYRGIKILTAREFIERFMGSST